ncbi:hypothetical protein D3C78_1949200 [compost metagenome]
MIREQATRIEPQPSRDIPEPIGCLGAVLLFAAMLGAVYATPYVIAWGYLIWSST